MSCDQHPLVNDFPERQVRIQMKEQIDRMKRRKILVDDEFVASDEGDSLEQPTIKKNVDGGII